MKTKQITTESGIVLLLVEVPEGAQDFKIESDLEEDFCQLEYLVENTDVDSGFCGDWGTDTIDLPLNNWQGKHFKEMSEEECAPLAEPYKEWGVKNYEQLFGSCTSKDLFTTIIKYHGFDPETTVVLTTNES